MKYIIGLSLLGIALQKAQGAYNCLVERTKGAECCKDTNTPIEWIDADGYWGQQMVNGKKEWCGVGFNVEFDFEIPESCWAKIYNRPCCESGTEVKSEDIDGRKWGTLYTDKIKNNNGYLAKVECGIIEKEDESVTVNLRDRKKHFDFSEYGDYEDTSKCWTMAKRYTDVPGKYLQYPCCEPGTKVAEIDENGKWGKNENGEYCGIVGGQKPWNDRELVEETREEWNAFKKVWNKESEKYNFERIAVMAGEDESQLNFGWYSKENKTPWIRISQNKDMSEAREIQGTVAPLQYYNYTHGKMEDYVLFGSQYYTNRVTVTGIEPHSNYYYQRKMNGKWESAIAFSTYDAKNFKFVFMGDPQIGGSHNHYTRSNGYTYTLSQEEATRNDAFNWKRALDRSVKFAQNPSLVFTIGDQADMSNANRMEDLIAQESQYSAYLYPPLMQQVPIVNCVGNHEKNTENYRNHFNVPHPYLDFQFKNDWVSAGFSQGWTPGYSYYLKYNNVLVVSLETNYHTCTDFQRVMQEATTAYPEADWRIAIFHHDIFGIGYTHSQQTDIMKYRKCLTRLFTDYAFDLVINAHDHVYTTSHFIKYVNRSGDIENFDDYTQLFKTNENLDHKTMVNNLGEGFYEVTEVKEEVVNENPKGTLYITANCSSGSKYLNFETINKEYVYNFKQTFTSTFGILDFKKEKDTVTLTIDVYETETYKKVDGPFILQKKAKIAESECWSEELFNIPCCPSNYEIAYADDDGYWGYLEDGSWCGIVTEVETDRCWTKGEGYQCCPKNVEIEKVDEFDDYGHQWGLIKGTDIYCGIIPPCWSEPNYRCCPRGTEIVSEEDGGVWGVYEGQWCGIEQDKKSSATSATTTKKSSTTTTTTTKKSTTTTTKKSTTTTTTTTKKSTTTTTTTTKKSTTTTTTTTTTKTSSSATNCAQLYQQCGGIDYKGPTCCAGNLTCIKYNDYYSQCENRNNQYNY